MIKELQGSGPLIQVGVDTGGTFTDFIVCREGKIEFLKLPSTPATPEKAVLEGLDRILNGVPSLIKHGSTVATNALLERKGAKTLLVTTRGFEDLLEIGRQNRQELYSFSANRSPALVPRNRRVGIKERILHDGTVLFQLAQETLNSLLEKVQRQAPEAIAVVLLHSYVNSQHEDQVAQVLKDIGIPVSLSSQILPEFREFERTSATVVNAYLTPVVDKYLDSLRSSSLVRKSCLSIMQSNGGMAPVSSTPIDSVRTLLSGPAGGVVGAFKLASRAGYEQIITLDMGGTSTDVCLCDGRVPSTGEAYVSDLPLSIQTIPIHSVGAGGGSIAWIDTGGLLRVGPKSAQSSPGPVCYGRGRNITVTDAHLFLGRLDPDRFLGGEMKLYPRRLTKFLKNLESGFQDHSWSLHDLSEGIIKIANTQMETALRMISLEKGYDTRDFTLVSFGGAGGLHACELAKSLMIPRVLIPPSPGLVSARGMLESGVIRDLSCTTRFPFNDESVLHRVQDRMAPMIDQALRQLVQDGFDEDDIDIQKSIDLRYLGQGYEINVPYSRNLFRVFHKEHERLFGFSNPDLDTEVVTLRVRALGHYPDLSVLENSTIVDTAPKPKALGRRKVFYEGRPLLTRFYDREQLMPGVCIKGPAVVTEYSATSLIPPGFQGRVDRWRNIIIEPLKG